MGHAGKANHKASFGKNRKSSAGKLGSCNGRQLSLFTTHWKHRFSHGGILRKSKHGRGARPLSSKDPLHLVFKANKSRLRFGLRSYQSFRLIHQLIDRYSVKFYIRVEQVSVNHDHIHFLIRTTRRSSYQSFFRVLAGQIAQQFEKEGLLKAENMTDTPQSLSKGQKMKESGRVIDTGKVNQADDVGSRGTTTTTKLKKVWMYRPFTRVIKGWKAYLTVQDYIQLNEKEVTGTLAYRKTRLRGLSSAEWEVL